MNIIDEMKNTAVEEKVTTTKFVKTANETEILIKAGGNKIVAVPWIRSRGRKAQSMKPTLAYLPDTMDCTFSNAVLKYAMFVIQNELESQEKAGIRRDVRIVLYDSAAITAFSYFGALRKGEDPVSALTMENYTEKDIEIITQFCDMMDQIAESGNHVFFEPFRNLLMFDLDVPEDAVIENGDVLKFYGNTATAKDAEGNEVSVTFASGYHTVTQDYKILVRMRNGVKRYFASRSTNDAYSALLSDDLQKYEEIRAKLSTSNQSWLSALKVANSLVPNVANELEWDTEEVTAVEDSAKEFVI